MGTSWPGEDLGAEPDRVLFECTTDGRVASRSAAIAFASGIVLLNADSYASGSIEFFLVLAGIAAMVRSMLWVKRARRMRLVLRISRSGLTDAKHGIDLLWSEVAAVRVRHFRLQVQRDVNRGWLHYPLASFNEPAEEILAAIDPFVRVDRGSLSFHEEGAKGRAWRRMLLLDRPIPLLDPLDPDSLPNQWMRRLVGLVGAEPDRRVEVVRAEQPGTGETSLGWLDRVRAGAPTLGRAVQSRTSATTPRRADPLRTVAADIGRAEPWSPGTTSLGRGEQRRWGPVITRALVVFVCGFGAAHLVFSRWLTSWSPESGIVFCGLVALGAVFGYFAYVGLATAQERPGQWPRSS